MDVCLNGNFLPEKAACISVFDRGFLYGDGLFETMRVSNGRLFRWEAHLERFDRGLTFLRLKCPFAREVLAQFASELIERNRMKEGVLRLAVSRGVGLRGYSPRGADDPSVVMSLHPLPPGASTPKRLVTASSVRLSAVDPLTRFKTSNKLVQILARMEADEANADEALLLDEAGNVAEAASGNVFWIRGGRLFTPPLECGALAGITRGVVLELAGSRGNSVEEARITPQQLAQADGVFLTYSSVGIAESGWLDGAPMSGSPLYGDLQRAYQELLEAETRG